MIPTKSVGAGFKPVPQPNPPAPSIKPARLSGAFEREAEERALARFALYVHRTPVSLYEAAGNGEAKPCAGCVVLSLTSPRLFAPEGGFEHAGQVFGRYALARVGDFDPRHIAFGRCAQGHRAVRRGVAEGVGD